MIISKNMNLETISMYILLPTGEESTESADAMEYCGILVRQTAVVSSRNRRKSTINGSSLLFSTSFCFISTCK